MDYTPNLNLAKPAGTDKVDVSVLNSNMDIIDSASEQWGGGVSASQSDWDENDSSKVSYVKNRPFYETTETLEDTTLDSSLNPTVTSAGGSTISVEYPIKLGLEVGTTYSISVMVAGEEPFTLESVAVAEGELTKVVLGGEELGSIYDGANSSQEPSDNSCVWVAGVPAEYIPWISIVFNGVPSTVNRVHKLDNKFFDSYSPDYKSVERVVGYYFGEPLYEYDLIYNHDGETNTFSIPSPIETNGIEWIEDAVLIGYDSDGYYQTTFRPFTNPNPNSNYDYEFDLYLDTSRSIYVGYGSDLWINIDQSASTSHKYQVLIKLRYTKPDSLPIMSM